jgi:hypothetical protein
MEAGEQAGQDRGRREEGGAWAARRPAIAIERRMAATAEALRSGAWQKAVPAPGAEGQTVAVAPVWPRLALQFDRVRTVRAGLRAIDLLYGMGGEVLFALGARARRWRG